MTEDLSKFRQQIDALDAEILAKLNARAAIARQVGSLKAGQAYRPEREAEVLRRIQALNEGPLPDEVVARLFREIMSACLALERPVTVAYLGPRGTFSGQQAAPSPQEAPSMLPHSGPQIAVFTASSAVEPSRRPAASFAYSNRPFASETQTPSVRQSNRGRNASR